MPEKPLEIPRVKPCEACSGTGKQRGTGNPCPVCGGRGDNSLEYDRFFENLSKSDWEKLRKAGKI